MSPALSRLVKPFRPPVPLGRAEIGLLALFALVSFTQGWAGAVITHALPFVREDFGLSDSQVFDLLSVVRTASLLALLFSWWGDRSGRRVPLLVAFVLLPAFNLATVAVPSAPWFAAAQAGARIGTIALGSLAIVVLAEELNPLARGYGLGVAALFASMGTGFGLLLRFIGESGSDAWRILFALSGLPLVVFPLLYRRLAESRVYRRPPRRPPLREALRGGLARYFWPMAGVSAALSAFTSPAANLALVRMENELGWSAGAASLLLAATSAPGVTIGLLAGGRMADTVGRRPTEAIAIGVGVAGATGFYFSDQPVVMGVAIFFAMIGSFAFAPAFGSHRSELFPTRVRATAGAWLSNAAILGGILGYAAGRWVVDAWGIPSTIALLGGILVASSSLLLLVPETKGVEITPDEADLPEPPAATPW
jgi:MFS family permease